MAVQTVAEAAMVVRPDFTRAGPEIRRQGRGVGKAIGEETAGSFLTSFSGAVSRGGARLGGVMEKVAATFFVGDFIRRIASFGLQAAASLEQAQIGFETLLGSARQARLFLGNLQKFAASTPFELPGLIDASRTLLGVGVNAKQVIPLLTAFGNTAGAVGVGQEAFQRIMIATSQAISAGKFQAGDLNQIMNNGIPIWSILAKATGKPVPELRKMASAGKLLSKDVLPALERQMQKDYGGAMARQSQTLAGVWSTLKDSISIGLAGALKPLVPLLSEAIPKAATFFSSALKAGSEYVVAFAEGFKGAKAEGEGLRGFLATIGGQLAAFIAGFREAGASVEGVESPMGDLARLIRTTILPYLQAVWEEISTELLPALAELATNGFGTIGPIVYGVAQTLHGVVIPALAGLAEWLNHNESTTRNLAISIGILVGATKVWELVTKGSELAMRLWGITLGKNGVIAKAYSLGVWLAVTAEKAHGVAMSIGNSAFVTRIRVMAIDFAAWARSTAAKIADTAATVAHRIATAASAAATAAHTLATRISSAATVAWTAVQTGAAVAARVLKVATMALWTTMKANPIGAIITIITLLVTAIIYLYNHNATAKRIIDAVWKGIRAVISWVADWIVGTAVPAIRRAIDNFMTGLRQLGAVASFIWRGIRTIISTEWKIVFGIFTAIRTAITQTLPNAFRSGVAAIAKFWAGLQEAARKPVRFVVNSIINPFLGGFKRIAGVFGVKTPDPITGFQEGGRVPGPASNRDNRIAWLRDASGRVISNIKVATGEFIVNARDTAKAMPLLQWINQGMKGGPSELARRLGRRPADRMGDGSEGWAFARGGLVGFLSDVWGAVSNPAKLVKAPIEALINRIPGGGQIRDLLVGMGHKLLSGFTSWLKGEGGTLGGNVGRAQAFVRSQAGKPYVWAAAGPGGYDCSGIVSAVYNVLKGRNAYSHTFSTESLPGQWFREGARTGALVAGWAHPGQRGASAGVGHMAGNVGGLPFESSGSRGVHVGPSSTAVGSFAHIGAARAAGGLVELQRVAKVARADFGRLTLAPGTNIVYNGLGRSEHLDDASGGGGPDRLHPDDIDALAVALADALGRVLLGTVPATRVAARQAGRRRTR